MIAEFVARQESPSDALPEALDILAEARRVGDPRALAMAHHTLAMCFHMVDCVSEALEYAHQSLDLLPGGWRPLRRGKGPQRARHPFSDLGDPAKAQPLFQQAHDVFVECDDPSGAGVMLTNAAKMQHESGDPAAAEATCLRALESFEKAGMPLDAMIAMHVYGQVLAALDQRELAARWLKRAKTHNRGPDGSIVNPTYEITRLLIEARAVHNPRGDMEAARASLDRRPGSPTNRANPGWVPEARSALAEVLRGLGDLAGAYDNVVRSRLLTQEFARESQDRRVRALRVQFEVAQAEREAQLYREQAQVQSEIIADLERTREELADRMTDLQRLNAETAHLSRTDPLTGMPNRRHMDEAIAQLCRASSRYGTPLALALFDVDRFKGINDEYGHEVGDHVLVALTQLVLRHQRDSDLPARLGGDEFMVIMPGVTGSMAMLACRRLLAAIRGHPWEALAPGLAVTITIGVIDGTGEANPAKLLRLADEALYRGKQAGRDVVSH